MPRCDVERAIQPIDDVRAELRFVSDSVAVLDAVVDRPAE
jgi:hypothetical protein